MLSITLMGVKDREKTVIGGIGVSHLLRNVAQKCKKIQTGLL